MFPSASMSMRSPPGLLLRPGIVRMSPAIGVTKPAPALRRTSRIGSRKPVGRPFFVPSVELDCGRAADLHFYLDSGIDLFNGLKH